jgi:hypothetical protein
MPLQTQKLGGKYNESLAGTVSQRPALSKNHSVEPDVVVAKQYSGKNACSQRWARKRPGATSVIFVNIRKKQVAAGAGMRSQPVR